MHVIRLIGVTYLDNVRLAACFDYCVHGDLIQWLKIRQPGANEYVDTGDKYRQFSTSTNK